MTEFGAELNGQLIALMHAHARACVAHDKTAWSALVHPKALGRLDDLVTRYLMYEAFRSPPAVKRWALAPVWEATETKDVLDFVPAPLYVARRRWTNILTGSEEVASERMLSEHDGRLCFVLRDCAPETHDALEQAITRQEQRWREGRAIAGGLPQWLRDEVVAFRDEYQTMRALKRLRKHQDYGPIRSIPVVQVLWADEG